MIARTSKMADHNAGTKFSESDMIIVDFNTGKISIDDAADFHFLVDEKELNCKVLIPESILLYNLKVMAGQANKNDLFFDTNTTTMKYSFGEITYHHVYVGNAAMAFRELTSFQSEYH